MLKWRPAVAGVIPENRTSTVLPPSWQRVVWGRAPRQLKWMARLLAMRLCSRTFECQYAAITTNPELSCVISLSFSSVCLQHPWIWCHLLCNLCLLYLKKKKIKNIHIFLKSINNVTLEQHLMIIFVLLPLSPGETITHTMQGNSSQIISFRP